jgi:hypothetical protein
MNRQLLFSRNFIDVITSFMSSLYNCESSLLYLLYAPVFIKYLTGNILMSK